MESYTAARDNALQQIVDWSRDNLRKRDQIAVVDFAGAAGVRQPPTSAARRVRIGHAGSLTDGSEYRPVLDAIADFPPTSCKTALVLLSDGALSDLPTDASESGRLLKQHDIKFQRLLVPSTAIAVPPDWSNAFPNGTPVFVDGLNPDETALVIAETVAKIIGTEVDDQ